MLVHSPLSQRQYNYWVAPKSAITCIVIHHPVVLPSKCFSVLSPQERSDQLQQLGSRDHFLVEQGDAAQEVLVHFLALEQAANLSVRKPKKRGKKKKAIIGNLEECIRLTWLDNLRRHISGRDKLNLSKPRMNEWNSPTLKTFELENNASPYQRKWTRARLHVFQPRQRTDLWYMNTSSFSEK